MKSNCLIQTNETRERNKKAISLHEFIEKKINNTVHIEILLRNGIHQVVVIFSKRRLQFQQGIRKSVIYYLFTLLKTWLILNMYQHTAMKKVEYCLCGIRRKSMDGLFLWTASASMSSHLISPAACFDARASSVMNERGNLRYIAKLRLMKGENA